MSNLASVLQEERELDGRDPRVTAAIALGLALARRAGAALPDSPPGSGGMSAWRAVMAPGSARLGAGGGRRG